MLVAVGSTNPTKIDPVKKVFSHHFKNVKVVGVKVDSGVKEQPLHVEEIFEGALTRSKNVLKTIKRAHYGVGIEGGLHQYHHGWFKHSIVVILDRKGRMGIGASGGLILPKKVVDRICYHIAYEKIYS